MESADLPGTTQDELELKFQPGVNFQIKLHSTQEHLQAERTRELIVSIFDPGQYDASPLTEQRVEDLYFDTTDLKLFHTGRSFRVRSDGATFECTLKLPTDIRVGEQQRVEVSTQLSKEAYGLLVDKGLLPNGPHADLIVRRLGDVLSAGARLVPMFFVRNHRRQFLLAKGDEGYEASLDSFDYRHTGFLESIRTPRQFEIEIEAKSPAAHKNLRAFGTRLRVPLEEGAGFVPSLDSKYQRGVALLGLTDGAFVQKVRDLAAGKNAQVFLFALGVLSFVLALISIAIALR